MQIYGLYFCVWFWATMPMIQSPSTILCQECTSFRPHAGLCLLATGQLVVWPFTSAWVEVIPTEMLMVVSNL